MPLSHISVFQPRGQCIVLLFAALRELTGSNTRRNTVQFISEHQWFAIELDDLKPYPSQKRTREPRWQTLIAWGRKDSVLRDLVLSHERDAWALSREGNRRWDEIAPKFRSGEWTVAKGYLWSVKFKKHLCPDYVPSATDAKRPWRFYDDLLDYI